MRLIFSGGGTAGHVNPALNIADYLIQQNKKKGIDTQILFVGTSRGVESKLVPNAGFEISFLEVEGLKRKLDLRNFRVLYKALKAMYKSKKILKNFKPDIVIGTGGYVCGPLLYAASNMGIKTLIHEQNAIPGFTTRLLQKKVDVICTGFNESEKFLTAKKIIYSGNPVKSWFDSSNLGEKSQIKDELYQSLRFSSKKPLVIAFGGSLGAQKINEVVVECIKKTEYHNFNLLLACGTRFYDELKSQNLKTRSFKIMPYINDLSKYIAVADLVISRAGAMTVSEIQNNRTPSILIPSPNVTNNHQEYNARSLEKFGSCKVLLESEVNADVLLTNIDNLLNQSTKLLDSPILDSNLIIYNAICDLINK